MNKSDRAELKRLIVQIERDLAQVHLRTPWTASGTTIATQQEETTINELMVRQMKLRRRALPEQRQASASNAPVRNERRRISVCRPPTECRRETACAQSVPN